MSQLPQCKDFCEIFALFWINCTKNNKKFILHVTAFYELVIIINIIIYNHQYC